MRSIFLFIIAVSFFSTSLNAKQLPKFVSESVVEFDGNQKSLDVSWIRNNKYDDHVIVIKLKNQFQSFKIKPQSDLKIGFWHLLSGKPNRQNITQSLMPIDHQRIILEISDDRTFQVFDDEKKSDKAANFQLDLELLSSNNTKMNLVINIISTHGTPKTPYEKSFLMQLFKPQD